jgi:CBS domain containing-hemolysin-like protein
MGVTEVLLISLAFVLVNGIFVAAEFALVATPRTTLEHRAAAGSRSARRMLTVVESPARQDRYVATSQLGITLASLGLGMFGEHQLASLIEPLVGELPAIGGAALAGALALGGLTLAHIVLGEMVPKGVALQHADRVARLTFWPMRLTLVVLYPFIALANVLATLVLRVVGIRRQANVSEQVYTPEELALIVEESAGGGVLRADAGRLLHELFEFGDLTAGQAMVPRIGVAGLPVGATPDEIRRVVTERRHTRYAIFEGDLDHIIGMLHVKDLLRRLLLHEPIGAADVRRMPVVPETARLDDVLATMQRAHAHMAVVIDEHGGTAGIITLEDLFEEVVGEIDEGAPKAPTFSVEPDGSVLVAGTVRLDELGQHFDLDLEHEEVDSVSGLVLAVLGRPPRTGDVIEYGRVRVEVTATKGRGVARARVSLLPPASDSAP